MKIQIGEVYMDKVTQSATIYPNKTKKYLLPYLKEYGPEFADKFDNVFKVAAGVGDIVVSNSSDEVKYEKHIFLLVHTLIASRFFINFLDWIREQPMYEDDYVYDNIQKSMFHMVVIKFPEEHYTSYDAFKGGQYSKMLKKSHTIDYFIKSPEVSSVLVKDHNYRIRFVGKINRKYNSTIKPEEWEGELELPPTDRTEVFNDHLKKK